MRWGWEVEAHDANLLYPLSLHKHQRNGQLRGCSFFFRMLIQSLLLYLMNTDKEQAVACSVNAVLPSHWINIDKKTNTSRIRKRDCTKLEDLPSMSKT